MRKFKHPKLHKKCVQNWFLLSHFHHSWFHKKNYGLLISCRMIMPSIDTMSIKLIKYCLDSLHRIFYTKIMKVLEYLGDFAYVRTPIIIKWLLCDGQGYALRRPTTCLLQGSKWLLSPSPLTRGQSWRTFLNAAILLFQAFCDTQYMLFLKLLINKTCLNTSEHAQPI